MSIQSPYSRLGARPLLGLAVLAALQAHAAEQARTPDPARASARALDTVTVFGKRSSLEARAGSGTRLDLSVMRTPASVSVIDHATLDKRGVRNTQEALNGVAGVTSAATPGTGNAVSYRGFSGNQITQLFNGIDVKYATIAARPVDAWQYARVEAIGGPSSFLYGAGAVGGSINYITALARLDRPETRMQMRIGNFTDATFAFGLNRVFGKHAGNALRLDTSLRKGGSAIERANRNALTTSASWLTRLTPDLSHTLAVEYQRERNDRPYWGTPAFQSQTGRLLTLAETRRRNYNVQDGYYGQKVLWARSLTEWTLDERNTVRNTVYHYDALRDYRNVESYKLVDDNTAIQRSGTLLQRHDQQVFGNRLEWAHAGTLGSLDSRWNFGLEWSFNRQTTFPLSVRGVFDIIPLESRAPGYFLDVPGTSLTYTPSRTNRLHTGALYVENLTDLTPTLSLLTGLRHERIALDIVNHRAVSAANPMRFQRTYRPTTGRAALNWAITPDASIYVQYSTAADPPAGALSTASFAALRDFDLSTGQQQEIGSKWRSANGRHHLTLAGYRIVRRNLAVADPANPGETLPVGQQSSRGVELTFGWRPVPGLKVDGNLAWSRATLDDFHEREGTRSVSRAGATPRNTPSRVGNLWVEYAFAPRWSVSVNARGVSSRYANNANTLSTAGYGLWGAQIAFEPAPGTQVRLQGRNLGDKSHVIYAFGDGMVYLGNPRNWELTVNHRF
ncbi:TonB-dependent receptor [Lysobacter pythonis]|uniref:TonB-dependent receptor n=1 Tax=Solilutibacter pythonis TaxID=2483112 RepID=A0A3M2HFZ9_9GAMM|nr:TonB-dependent receptor [Lysobacter pythonis]RMH87888.1 TonB-dependent receptor [Lysobacter pythonis]